MTPKPKYFVGGKTLRQIEAETKIEYYVLLRRVTANPGITLEELTENNRVHGNTELIINGRPLPQIAKDE